MLQFTVCHENVIKNINKKGQKQFWRTHSSKVYANKIAEVNAFLLLVSCCVVHNDFRMKTIFGSSLPPVIYRRARVLFTLFVFVCVKWCPTLIVLCFCLFPFALCALCCQFLCIIHFGLSLRYSLTFIHIRSMGDTSNLEPV